VDDPQAAAEALVQAAVEAGGRDNVTVIVVALDSGGDDDFDVDTAPRREAGSQA
jgi:protein phosphatase